MLFNTCSQGTATSSPTDHDGLVRQITEENPMVGWTDRPAWINIDLRALAHNLRQIRSLVTPQVSILACLKANAYGHGALQVARTVLSHGASRIGVAMVSEAKALREAGIDVPIHILGHIPLWQMYEAVCLDLTVSISDVNSASALSHIAHAHGKTLKVHLKVDTGMGRLGIRAEQTQEIVTLAHTIVRLPALEFEGIFTHLAMADALDKTHAQKQLVRFHNVLHALERCNLRPPLVHAANSAALLSIPEAHFNLVRPGIALYGLDPSLEVCLPQGFRPVLSFKTQVIQVKTVPTGEPIGYGCTYVTRRPSRIATLPIGYADGFRRAPLHWGTVLIHGQEVPIIGRVCMDYCMVDVTHLSQVGVGDEVILIGRHGSTTLSAQEIAQRLGTTPYELLSQLSARVPRVYDGDILNL